MIRISTSNKMKAIAILMVIAGHILGNYVPVNSYLCVVLGTGGVTVFLMLSGYGLAVSYQKKGITASFWKHKFFKVMIPYWIVTFLYSFSEEQYFLNWKLILKNFLFIDFDRQLDRTMWYLSFLMIWYVVFWLIFLIDFSVYIKIVILFLPAVWFFIHQSSSVFRDCAWQFCLNAFSFPLGAALGIFCRKRSAQVLSRIWVQILMILVSAAGIAGYVYLQTEHPAAVQIDGILVFFLLLGICLLLERVRWVSRCLDKIGDLSYMMYLLEGKWFAIVGLSGVAVGIWNVPVYIGSFILLMVLYALGKRAFHEIHRRFRPG